MSEPHAFTERYGNVLLELHADMLVAQAWRPAQTAKLESLEFSVGKLAGDVGHLCTRIMLIETMISHEKTGLLAWKTMTDGRLHDIERELVDRASTADLAVLKTRVSERAKANAESTPLKTARLAALAAVVAACIGAGWFVPTSCTHQTPAVQGR